MTAPRGRRPQGIGLLIGLAVGLLAGLGVGQLVIDQLWLCLVVGGGAGMAIGSALGQSGGPAR